MAKWIIGATDTSCPLPERVLRARGVEDKEAFLNPDFSTQLHSPALFPQMAAAVERIARAAVSGETVCIAGDYDVDGVSSSALLYRLLQHIEVDAAVYLPHRIHDGFGFTPEVVDRALEQGASLIITVDNGITAAAAVARAVKNGMDVIITDHHYPTEGIPKGAVAVINPAIPESGYPFSELCGAGVVYKLVDAVLSDRVERGESTVEERERFLKWNMDLVALATVADVVELVEENRVLAYFGLTVLRKSRKPGIRELCRVAACKTIDSETVAFRLAPRLNAAGRLDDPAAAFRLLVTEDRDEARELAEQLEKLNQQRQGMLRRAVSAAREQAERQICDGERILILENDGWHPGIVGLIAGRISDRYNMPALAFFSDEQKANWTASCRSLPAFDLTEMLARFQGLFVRSGGHALAAGLTVATENFPLFRESLFSYARKVLRDCVTAGEIRIDALARVCELTLDNCAALQRLAPFGQGNREPLLRINALKLTESRRVGSEGSHFRFIARGKGHSIVGIGFSLGDLAETFPAGAIVDCAAHLRFNEYLGRQSPQLILVDMKSAI